MQSSELSEVETTIDVDNLLLFLDERIQNHQELRTTTSDAIIIMRQYLEKPNLARKKDPIEYLENQDIQPIKTVTRKYLCVPATSVP